MKKIRPIVLAAILLAVLICLSGPASAAGDPLPYWRYGATKQTIIDFVDKVTREGGPDYVAPQS